RAVAGAQRENVARRITAEGQARGGRQDTGAGAAADVVVPANLSGLVIDRSQEGLAPDAVVGARPAIIAMFGLEEVDAVGVHGADDEEPRRRIEARRSIVRAASFVGRDEASVPGRLLRRIRYRPSVLVDLF